ncbi:TetR/AcrR family transcriptional regulator [Euzebya tangerina]|uniref:TetR/AcrR family transcriptional regulator n=1 Tax=Euzebya tangerina TaxID=591198 RepID=UPI00196ADB6C|nr:TetR/AcrR family transcriptional regulator [Euzebya tangerina]
MPDQPLTKDRVMDAAVTVADRGGVAAVTMRRVAEELGVEAMSLYHHVAKKDEILDGLVDRVFVQIPLPDRGEDWRSACRRRAHAARVVLAEHPWALGLMESRPDPGPATLAHHEAVLAVLRAGGFTLRQAVHAFSLMDSYIYGFALQEANLPFGDSAEMAEVAEGLGDLSAAYPNLAATVTELVLGEGYDFAEEFDVGLEVLLDGLDRLRR